MAGGTGKEGLPHAALGTIDENARHVGMKQQGSRSEQGIVMTTVGGVEPGSTLENDAADGVVGGRLEPSAVFHEVEGSVRA